MINEEFLFFVKRCTDEDCPPSTDIKILESGPDQEVRFVVAVLMSSFNAILSCVVANLLCVLKRWDFLKLKSHFCPQVMSSWLYCSPRVL